MANNTGQQRIWDDASRITIDEFVALRDICEQGEIAFVGGALDRTFLLLIGRHAIVVERSLDEWVLYPTASGKCMFETAKRVLGI